MISLVGQRRRHVSGIATLALVVSAIGTIAGLAPGCDRVVNLTPFYDAQPDPDAEHLDVGFGLDTTLDGGRLLPDGGFALDGSSVPEDGISIDGSPARDEGPATRAP